MEIVQARALFGPRLVGPLDDLTAVLAAPALIAIDTRGAAWANSGRAKLSTHGQSQALRLRKEFRLPTTEVRVGRQGRRVILEPVGRNPADVRSVFAEVDRLLGGIPFLAAKPGADAPIQPDPRTFFDA